MPELSRFLGIVIGMFYREHGVAHFHAVYGEHEVSVEVESGTVHGHFPPRALNLNGWTFTSQNYWRIGNSPRRANPSSESHRWSSCHGLPRRRGALHWWTRRLASVPRRHRWRD